MLMAAKSNPQLCEKSQTVGILLWKLAQHPATLGTQIMQNTPYGVPLSDTPNAEAVTIPVQYPDPLHMQPKTPSF
jgi:hypothetical protein